jgi:hypothetical protein
MRQALFKDYIPTILEIGYLWILFHRNPAPVVGFIIKGLCNL